MPISEYKTDLTSLGGAPFYILIILIFASLELWTQTKQLLLGLLITYIFYFTIRSIFFKPRPQPLKHKSWISKVDANTILSAHAMRITLLAFILGPFFRSTVLTILLILIVISVGSSRILLKRHCWSDVILGWVLGALIGTAVTFPY